MPDDPQPTPETGSVPIERPSDEATEKRRSPEQVRRLEEAVARVLERHDELFRRLADR